MHMYKINQGGGGILLSGHPLHTGKVAMNALTKKLESIFLEDIGNCLSVYLSYNHA